MTKKIKWRLGALPTPDEVTVLFDKGLLTKDEAREILFTEQNEKVRDAKSLESEIKFLRELVERLSKDKTKIVETIRYIEKPYLQYYWYTPYQNWCGGLGTTTTYTTGGEGMNNVIYTTATSGSNLLSSAANTVALGAFNNGTTAGNSGFSSISTF